MKKKLLILSLILLCLGLSAWGTVAFFTAEDTAHNVITSGNVSVVLVEQMESDGVLTDFPAEGVQGVMPGVTVSKIVTVQNTGDASAWIRVRLQPVILSETEEPLSLTLDNGESALIPVLSTDGWTLAEGWYYYDLALAPGEATAALMEGITFHTDMDNTYQNATVNVTVLAQAVQTANNGETAADAAGWPAVD